MKRALVVALLCLGGVAMAQPVTSGGLRKVTHGVSLSGDGTVASPLSVRTDCADGEVIKWDAGSTAWLCSTDDTIGGAAITGAGTANAIPKFTAADVIGDSLLTDNATTLAYAVNKFTVAAASGNTAIAGTLASGALTVTGAIAASGAITDTGNRVFSVAGDGLESSGATVSVNVGSGIQIVSDEVTFINTVIQSRVSGTCAAGAASAIASNGTVTCMTGSSDFSIAGDVLDLSSAVTAPGTMTIAGVLDVNDNISRFGAADGAVYINGDTINGDGSVNGAGALYLNFYGYAPAGVPGTTQFRDVVIADGKGATVATFGGSGKTLGITGLLTATAGVTTPANLTTTGTGDLVVADDATVAGTVLAGLASAVDNDSPGIQFFDNDDFLYDGDYINSYGFGAYNDSVYAAPLLYVSANAGLRFFTQGTSKCLLDFTGVLNCTAGFQENGTAVLSGAITANTIPKGSGGNLVDSGLTDDGTTFTYGGTQNQLGGNLRLTGNEFHFRSATNTDDTGFINFYSDGAAGNNYFRSLIVADGKGATVATFTGSDKSLAVVGNLTAAGTLSALTTGETRAQYAAGGGQTTAAMTDAGSRAGVLSVGNAGATAGHGGAVTFGDSASVAAGSLGYAAIKGLLVSAAGNTTGDLAFSTRNATGDTALTERMRIASTGAVTIPGTFYPGANIASNGNEIHFEDDQVAHDINGYISYYGCSNGTTCRRNTIIANGQGTAIATFTGSDFATTLTGALTAERITPATVLNDHTRGFEAFHEFLTVPEETVFTGTGANYEFDDGLAFLGGFLSMNAEANRPGLLTLRGYNSTDTLGGSAAPRYGRVVSGGGIGEGWFAGGGTTKVAAAFMILSTLSPPVDDTDSYTVHAGLFDNNTITGGTGDFAPNGIYCRVGSASANIQVCTSKADTQSCTDTTPAIAIAEDAWYRCEFTVNAAGTQVDFTVTNVTATTAGTASRTTQIPNAEANQVGLGVSLDTIDNAGTGAIYVDYLWMDQTFTTAR